MSSLGLILILAGVIVFLVVVIGFLIKGLNKKDKQISELQEDVEKLKNSMKSYTKYIESLSNINNEEKAILKEIENAKTDEEVFNIVNNLVKSNNGKLRTSKESGDRTSTKTGKNGTKRSK